MHKPKHTTHSHASSPVNIPHHTHDEATVDDNIGGTETREQSCQRHSGDDAEDGDTNGRSDAVEEQTEGLVELEQVVLFEEEGGGGGDDAEEDEEDGDDGRHFCCEVCWLVVGDLDVWW